MVDIFALSLTHALLALAAWRLMQRADLDADPAAESDDEPADGEPPARIARRAPRA